MRSKAKAQAEDEAHIDRIRRFERIHERRLRKTLASFAGEDLSVADIRVVQELWHAPGARSGAWVGGALGFDSGYLSRILRKLEAYRLVSPRPSVEDRRARDWELTEDGCALGARLELAFRKRLYRDLDDLLPDEKQDLFQALRLLEGVLLRLELARAARL